MKFGRDLPKNNKFVRILSNLEFSACSVPLALLVLCVLTYGLLVNRLGFYWDDWPWVWWSHVYGPEGMLKIDQGYRPLSGVILWLGALLAGKSPLSWQILNICFRWFSGLALWWSLRKIWPGHLERSIWVTLIFLVYPGFGQQFVSVNSSRHILPLATFFLSIGFMIWAVQEKRRYWPFTVIALLLSAISLLATDYYFGLEFVRPVILWLVVGRNTPNGMQRIKRTMKYWMPYLFLFGVLVVWRYLISPQANYPVVITGDIASQPVAATLDLVVLVLKHFVTTGFLAWVKAFEFPIGSDIRLRRLVIYWVLLIVSFILTFAYLLKLKKDATSDRVWKQITGLGVFSLLTAGLPFLVAGIPTGLIFPSDRTTLPMIFGASLLFVGVVDALAGKRVVKIIIIAAAVSLATGAQLLNAVSFENDWNTQISFFQQLTLRAPGLSENTALVYAHTPALQSSHSSDNSFTATLNWIYAPDFNANNMPYFLYDLRLRSASVIPSLENGQPLYSEYGDLTFKSPTDQVLMVQFAPPWCLQVLEPQFEGLYPHLPDDLAHSVKYSNPEVINLNPQSPAFLPLEVFGAQSDPDWCYFFQMADVARQRRDWQAVADLGDRAFQLIDPPKQPSERLPFILGYGYVGRWDRAEELTLETIKRDKNTQPMLCPMWSELAEFTPESDEKRETIARIMAKLKCQANE